MTETTARTYHTMESLRQMAQTDLRNVNREGTGRHQRSGN